MSKEMKIYLVGGAVRDELLGLVPQDIDYVVVNGSEEDFLARGYTKVGHSFPVFLHPETLDQYAFARKEKKVDTGYHGFEFDVSGVSLEDDLFRRDLTINAMAKDENGKLVDPFNGLNDLKNKLLRHVSVHFAEDPVRVLRVARFQARYTDFNISPETAELMKDLCAGEITSLLKDKEKAAQLKARIRAETLKALKEVDSFLYFKVLKEVGLFKAFNYDLLLPEKLRLSSDLELAMVQLALHQKDTEVFFNFVLELFALGKNNKKAMQSFLAMWKTSDGEGKSNLFSAFNRTKVLNTNVFIDRMKELSQLQNERMSFWKTVEEKADEAKQLDTAFITEIPASERSKTMLEFYSKLFEK